MQLELEGHPSDPAVAWDRLGDSDFLNRLAGNGRVELRLEPREGGASRIVGEMAGPLGTKMAFEEDGNAWLWRRWFRQERRYTRAAISGSRFELRLDREGDAVVPRIRLELEPASMLARPLLALRSSTLRARWQQALDALPRPGEQAAPALRRELSTDARSALDRWRPNAPAGVVDTVQRLLEQERESELRNLRAFEVADRFGLDRHETLVGMLRGVRAGVVELYWSVRCQRCRGEVAAATTLSNLADHASCPSCRLTFDTDLGETVEVRFAPHPAVMPRIAEKFCTMYPSGAPQLKAAFLLAPGQSVDDEIELPRGRFLLGPGGGAPDIALEVGDDGAAVVAWRSGGAGEQRLRAGRIALSVRNEGDLPQRVILVSRDADATLVPASLVATLPEFRRELGTQVLAPNVRIGTRSVALLFTDLSDSTAMYESVGDARAYGLVRDHFGIVGAEVERHGGVVVKTVGDAVMASFHSPGDAFEAALAMRGAFDAWIAGQEVTPVPRLNVGVHVGPALAVHSDSSGLDWFGRTVNLAARVQAAARGGALVLTEEVRMDRRVDQRVRDLGLTPAPFEADLKGIGRVALYRLP